MPRTRAVRSRRSYFARARSRSGPQRASSSAPNLGSDNEPRGRASFEGRRVGPRAPNGRGREKGAQLSTKDRTIVTDRKSTRLNSSHITISYAVFCLKKKK